MISKDKLERWKQIAGSNMEGGTVEVDQLELLELVEDYERVRTERNQWARIAGGVVTEHVVDEVLRGRA